MSTSNKKIISRYTQALIFFLMFAFQGLATDSQILPNPQIPEGNLPLEVSVTLNVFSIFNINALDESFQVDGWVVYSWMDERLSFSANDVKTGSIIYENEAVESFFSKYGIWHPNCEFMNVRSDLIKPYIRFEIEPDGQVKYNQRFYGTFSHETDYKKFPFDVQSFNIQIQPFYYDIRYVSFTNPKLYPDISKSQALFESWEVIDRKSSIEKVSYPHLAELHENRETYSNLVFEFIAKRNPGYYIWQVLLPLIIIILASFVVFWIEDFSTQIGIGFTLMLTVVAFNFYSGTILPKLPYNTFIESVILVGYIFIFLGILAVIIHYRIQKSNTKSKLNVMKHFRWAFPLSYILTMGLLYINYFN